ncbi:MAG: YicC family protein [Bacteroidetes bacterium]|nr:YicC family protein [Bacteroidota bacterium]
MILSMTGYGRCVKQLSDKIVTVEIKSLNSKSFDLNLRMPGYYRDRELDIRNILSQRLERGKIDLSIQLESTANTAPAMLNEKVVRDYLKQLKAIVDGDETELLKMAVRMPDALLAKPEQADENEWQEIFSALQEAAAQLFVFRKAEGKVLHKDFALRIQNIQSLLKGVEAQDTERLEVVKLRLRKAVDSLEAEVDENRFEQELIYYLEKFDITEEKVRLKNHLDYFSENLESPESNGKKLGFISQEIGREINTIGSKANHAATQQLVVQMKDELEKLKEQLLNIL